MTDQTGGPTNDQRPDEPWDWNGLFRRLRVLLEGTPWGDVPPAMSDIARTLGYLMELTRDEYVNWLDEFENDYVDEFTIPPNEARVRSPRWRLAHIAALIRVVAMAYGIETEWKTSEHTGKLTPHSPAAVLAEFAAIGALVQTIGTRMAAEHWITTSALSSSQPLPDEGDLRTRHVTGPEEGLGRSSRPLTEEARKAAGARIDPATAEVWFEYWYVTDPYAGIPDLPGELQVVGRVWFAADPDERVVVNVDDLPPAVVAALQEKIAAEDREAWQEISLAVGVFCHLQLGGSGISSSPAALRGEGTAGDGVAGEQSG